MKWSVYLVRCCDNTLYCGVATDTAKRVKAHNNGTGAKYTRGRNRRPVKLVYTETGYDKSGALKREYEIKQLSKDRKELLVRLGGKA